MSEAEIIHDAEVIGTELEPVQHGTLFRTEDPLEVIARATRIAAPLADLVRKQKLTSNIQGREHVRVEGWTLLGSMLGVFPVCEWTRKMDDGWEARVVARTLGGHEVGSAEAQCLRSESTWAKRDDYALRSMAQTRATSKALRVPLGFVMQLAGFDPTPAEEMPRDRNTDTWDTALAPPRSSDSSEKQAEVRQNQDAKTGVKVPTSWAKLTELVSSWDEATHDLFFAFRSSLIRFTVPDSDGELKSLPKPDKDYIWQKCVGAALELREKFEPSQLPYPGLEDVRAAFESVAGVELAIPEEELDTEAAEAAEREA